MDLSGVVRGRDNQFKLGNRLKMIVIIFPKLRANYVYLPGAIALLMTLPGELPNLLRLLKSLVDTRTYPTNSERELEALP